MRKQISHKNLQRKIKGIEPFKKAFDVLADHVIITDSNANILYANKAVERNTGFSQQETIGKNPGDLWGGNMPKEFYERMWRTAKKEKKSFVAEVQNKRKDGTMYWQELHISPILDGKGEVRFFIAIEPNITSRKEKERFKKKFLFETSRQISHPLSATIWVVNWLLANSNLEEDERKALKSIVDNNETIIDLFDELIQRIRE